MPPPSTSTPLNTQTTQLFTLTLHPSLPNNDPQTFEPAKAITRCLLKLKHHHPTLSQISWALNLSSSTTPPPTSSSSNSNTLHIYITHPTPNHASSFLSSPRGPSALFSSISLPPTNDTQSLPLKTFNLTGSISHTHPTESIIFYFPTSLLTEPNKNLFENQLNTSLAGMQSRENGQEIHILSIAQGWGVGTTTTLNRDDGEEVEAGYYIILIAWSGLEGMGDVKADRESVFNNMFAPLKNIAVLGTEGALYMSLRAMDEQRGCCVM